MSDTTGIPDDPTDLVEEEVWEELADDNGEIIEFKPGSEQQGFFVHQVVIDLSEDQQEEQDKETAELLVFEAKKDTIETRWSVWMSYSLKKVNFLEGDYYSLRCLSSRKTGQGEMKVFSVRHRKSAKVERF